MITHKRKQDCCGCTACANICPKQCIRMEEDNEGFLYPITDTSMCINCNACNNVCPILNNKAVRIPLQCYAAKNIDAEILLQSSSGGVFSVLAEYVLNKGGVVFGARWEEDKVIHDCVESTTPSAPQNFQEMIAPFRGSKYVQSELRDTFKQAQQFLRDGRLVLFTGTPCEIGGLKSFLRRDYSNLIAVDIACHGAPSPKVLSLYIQELKSRYKVPSIEIDFRNKATGWKHYRFSAKFNGKELFNQLGREENIFMRGFLSELYSRPSCHYCSFKSFRSQSDITLADFWGIEKIKPNWDYKNGVSLVTINSFRGAEVINSSNLKLIPVDYESAISYNGSMLHSEEPHPKRDLFFRELTPNRHISTIIHNTIDPHGIDCLKLYLAMCKNKLRQLVKLTR